MKRLLILSFLLCASWAMAQSHPEGLVFEAEDWSSPKDAIQLNQSGAANWQIWTKEEAVELKRSRGASVTTPVLPEVDRERPEDGAPVLHTRITGIPRGTYSVSMNHPNRPLALSFDGGKTWQKIEKSGDESFGIYAITDGVFEMWVDDRFASADRGWAYFDFVRFVPFEGGMPRFEDLRAFVPPLEETTARISWVTSEPAPFAALVTVAPKDGSAEPVTVEEAEDGLRNHSVTLENLVPGREYVAEVFTFVNRSNEKLSEKIEFRAERKRAEKPTQKMSVALTVVEPTEFARLNWPVTSGVPFAQGALASAENVRLEDASGKPVKAQFTPAAFWPDGSIQWLTVDFLADTPDPKAQNAAPARFTLVLDPDFKAPKGDWVKVSAGTDVSSEITFADGTRRYACLPTSEMTFDSKNTVRKTLIQSGSFMETPDAEPDLNAPGFRCRLECSVWEGAGLQRTRWTVGNAQLDEPFALIRSVTLKTKEVGEFEKTHSFRAFQDLPDHASVEEDGQKSDCERFDGFAEFREGQSAVLLNHFWQTWPKSMTITQDTENLSLELGILPELPAGYGNDPKKNEFDALIQSYYWLKDDCYRFKRGMQLTTEFWSADGRGDDPHLREHLEHPLFAACSPEYYCSAGVFAPMNPVRPGFFDGYENAFRKSWANHLAGREKRGEYGWMNFGDWFGERTNNWGNNEYDLSFLCALQFARSGNLDLLWRGVEMAQHYSTIDFKRYPWKQRDRDLIYEHCFGHVNWFFEAGDPRLTQLSEQLEEGTWWLRLESDGSGGHDAQTGNFFIGCLTGDPTLLDVAQTACTAQAKNMTPAFNFSIERSVGWAMVNACSAYHFTNDPLYLNAARLYFEKVLEKQNPETGCFDLPQDQTECDCPDKKEHRGGKAFAVGMLLHGLGRYYELEPDPARREQIKTVMVRCSEWLLNCAWNEKKNGFRYKTGCPKYADHSWYAILVIDGLTQTSAITGDRKYVDFVVRTAGGTLEGVSSENRGSGKDFTQKFRQTPYALYWIEALTGKTKCD